MNQQDPIGEAPCEYSDTVSFATCCGGTNYILQPSNGNNAAYCAASFGLGDGIIAIGIDAAPFSDGASLPIGFVLSVLLDTAAYYACS